MTDKPPRDFKKTRNFRIGFRVRPDEYHRIHENAASVDMTVPQYLRSAIIDGHIVVPRPEPTDPETFAELQRLGREINQAVREFHTTGRMPPELLSLARDVDRLIREKLSKPSSG